ncbi:MAG: hypothetical protein ABWY12_19525 [Burkholderiales bacterium]
MKLQKAIAACCERAVDSGEEFDAEDVLACLYANYPQEIAKYFTNRARAARRQ